MRGDGDSAEQATMILRRFANALREQNWATIVIEFVLLVAGVFLGIQAANWNAERESDRRSVVFTERLKSDLRIEACAVAKEAP
jgi:hypothetical protein